MRRLITMGFILIASFASAQLIEPDLNKPEDLKKLGAGKIFEKDNSAIKNIILLEIKDYWIVYLKDGSTHDLNIQSINRIEFPASKWGILYMRFTNNKPDISWPTP